MEPTTLRLPEELADKLTEEANELGYSSRSEYIRHILRNRTDTGPNTPSKIEALADRLDGIETRLDNLEGETATSSVNAGGVNAGESAAVPIEPEPDATSNQDDRKAPATDSESSPALDAAVGDDIAAAVEDVAAGWEDAANRLEARKAAAALVLQHAVETGDAVGKSSDVVADIRGQHPVEGQSTDTYWRKNIRPVLKKYGQYNQGKHGYVVTGL